MPAANARTRRDGLTRERILHAALALVEREGAEALTMRRLGDELGVEAMSLYHHVPNREAVLDGLGELLMTRIEIPEPGSDWSDACRAFAAQLRALTLDHPQAFRLIGLRPLASPAALAPVERLLQCLVAAGAGPATGGNTRRRSCRGTRLAPPYAQECRDDGRPARNLRSSGSCESRSGGLSRR
ncbi:TetR family transcriptional regulator [Baekduia soli]|uniref:TetR family transcriptional regulator n=1 Tax=Baekduia soli TaxID=496014 RepID=A0A5B8U5K3_9ACTN|nr:TetR family transcriptional regulator [Baekduia soli]QEC48267.1 TetR family transcriptional regulator [Baekduia soli]